MSLSPPLIEELAVAISAHLHSRNGLQPLVWHQARGISTDLAVLVHKRVAIDVKPLCEALDNLVQKSAAIDTEAVERARKEAELILKEIKPKFWSVDPDEPDSSE